MRSALILLMGLVASIQEANACSCINPFINLDSLSQVAEFDFIAHIRVISAEVPRGNKRYNGMPAEPMGFTVVELFKGQPADSALEYGVHSSCDIGFSTGEEWIVFGRKNKQGGLEFHPCDYHRQYKAAGGLRDWKYRSGIWELEKLRKLFGHPEPRHQDGPDTAFYPSGKVELREAWKNNMLTGERLIYYPDGTLYAKQFFVDGKQDGRDVWYYPSGQIYEESFFRKGVQYNILRLYYDSLAVQDWVGHMAWHRPEDTAGVILHRLQTEHERIYNPAGIQIGWRHFKRNGAMDQEERFDPVSGLETTIYYHPNGLISYIGTRDRNGNHKGSIQEYDEAGNTTD